MQWGRLAGSRWSCWVRKTEIRRLGYENSWNTKGEFPQGRLPAGIGIGPPWAFCSTPFLGQVSLWLIKDVGEKRVQLPEPEEAQSGSSDTRIALTQIPKREPGKPILCFSSQAFQQHWKIKFIWTANVTKYNMLANNSIKHKWSTQLRSVHNLSHAVSHKQKPDVIYNQVKGDLIDRPINDRDYVISK